MSPERFEIVFRPQHSSAGPHTLDSPIRYEVWRSYALGADEEPVDLLLEPRTAGTETLAVILASQLGDRFPSRQPARAAGLMAIRLPFTEFLQTIIPLTSWRDLTALGKELAEGELVEQLRAAQQASEEGASTTDRRDITPGELQRRLRRDRQNLLDRFRWFLRLAAEIGVGEEAGSTPAVADSENAMLQRRAAWLRGQFEAAARPSGPITIESVSQNRSARGAIQRSRKTIKADAAHRVFDLSCEGLGWAIVDSGIDARHPAFRQLDRDGRPYAQPLEQEKRSSGTVQVNRTRIRETYDLTNARQTLAASSLEEMRALDFLNAVRANKIDLFPDPYRTYRAPGSDHGTHVAGILAANWVEESPSGPITKMSGICPDLDLWDLRVLDDHGNGDEFAVVSALRLVEAINRDAGQLVIHGVNLSVSITHQVANYACGWTPVCNACSDLIDSGVVVVASAGNAGFDDVMGSRRTNGANYRTVSISDPGNADKVITVGSTHPTLPHRYGISYFSARGPTADGRRKPDLLAPGEGICSPIPLVGDEKKADYKSYDGTSQAAPHVSGAAALLMARYPALRGQAAEVKRLLCDHATDLQRDPYFQGSGLVDVLRALQGH